MPIALGNANVVNVVDGTVQRNVSVVLRGGRIEAIGGAVPADVTTLDVRGRYVVPGLIDAHVHIEHLRALRFALESGVTTARSAGVAHYADVGLRELVKQGSLADGLRRVARANRSRGVDWIKGDGHRAGGHAGDRSAPTDVQRDRAPGGGRRGDGHESARSGARPWREESLRTLLSSKVSTCQSC